LKKRWGYEPWHYRSIDVESMALLLFGWDRPRGLKDIADLLRSLGYTITDPPHSARIDVVVLRECFYALKEEQRRLRNDALKIAER
jgi:hypothetical protein